jgi:putative transposase
VFFFTLVTYHRFPYFSDPALASLLLEVMGTTEQELSISREAFVLLPDHLHILHAMPESHGNYSKLWALVKLRFLRVARPLLSKMEVSLSASRQRIARQESLVWQNRFWEHHIRDSDDFAAHFHYIHFNPVKHGLVSHPADWVYSSFRHHLENGTYCRDWFGMKEWPKDVGHE